MVRLLFLMVTVHYVSVIVFILWPMYFVFHRMVQQVNYDVLAAAGEYFFEPLVAAKNHS